MLTHPLEPLTMEEIAQAVSILRGDARIPEGARLAHVVLFEPTKGDLDGFGTGASIERRARIQVVPGPDATVIETVVSLTSGGVESVVEVPEARPAMLFEESLNAIIAVMGDPQWQEALRKRGITDLDRVQIDPWPPGTWGHDFEKGRRLCRCICYLRDSPTDNGYAHPIEGLIAVVDMGRGEVIEIQDYGAVPIPSESGSYLPADVGELRQDLMPLEISQPDGPSWRVEGNLIRWQRWSMRVTMDPHEGMVLHTVGYEDGDRVRPILYRASVSEMVVPYGHPGPMHGWKNAFDAGEWGLGRMTQPLTLGCDCLGVIHYFDAVVANE
ncbi:MAG: primary-amine oxidase, partial [Acidimicrobiales bacterium]